MRPNDKNRVKLIKLLKASFCSEHAAFFFLITFCSQIFSVLKLSTVVATYFKEIRQYIIWIICDCMYRTVGKGKTKQNKTNMNKKSLSVTSLDNIIIRAIYCPDSKN